MKFEINWTPDMDAMLGATSDHVVARRLRLLSGDVIARRTALGIPNYEPVQREWTPEEDTLLGTDSLVALAKRFGCPTSQVQKRRTELGVKPKPRPTKSAETLAEEALRAERVAAKDLLRKRKAIETAEAVHREGSMSRAASRLGLNASTVRTRMNYFFRYARARLGNGPALNWRDLDRAAPVVKDFARCMSYELETGSLEAWERLKADLSVT